jgi:hypothetical protein
MKDKRSLHLKVQEMCDCYATTDPLKEMAALKNDANKKEAALKWLALAALHGVNANAEKISITRSDSGDVVVKAEYRVSELPSPGREIGEMVIAAAREITHLESDKAKSPLALGIRDSSIDIEIKVKKGEKGEKLTIKFPG